MDSMWTHLRGATVERVRFQDVGKVFEMVFSNGATLKVVAEAEFTGGGYDFHRSYLDVDVEPPVHEQDGWVVLSD